MKSCTSLMFLIFAWMCLLVGCTTYPMRSVGPVSLSQAQQELPEDELLDVGITRFTSDELTDKQMTKEGTHPDVRKAEGHFVPYHLKHTLQRSSQWGAVRVIPNETAGADLVVKGKIVYSNGERLILQVDVIDATGTTWLRKAYKTTAIISSYSTTVVGQRDAFQPLYNAIANDMAAFQATLTPDQVRNIRTIAQLRFAADFAPEAFGDYLVQDNKERFTLARLPADDDPMLERIGRIREREHLYVDTLNEYYDGFYSEMWPAYSSWRKANLAERAAIRQVRRRAITRQAIGALMMALAVGLGAGGVENTAALQLGLMVTGGQVIVNGINVTEQAEIHRSAIQEMSESFGSDIQSAVIEVQGKEYTLNGSVQEQYQRWRELLRKMYYTETGFPAPDQPQSPDQKRE